MIQDDKKLDFKSIYTKTTWENGKQLDEAVEEILQAMSFEDKNSLIFGRGFNAAAIESVGIPPLNMSDASMGMRQTPWPEVKGQEPATAFPATIMLSATWNEEIAYEYGKAVAEEFRARGIQVLLGPGINIYRHPQCGRNYEYLGEDPYLVSSLVVPYIKAVQEVGVMAVVKHFAANNSENKRKNSNSFIGEQALREIYLPGFEAAVTKGGVLGVMTGYNLLNGTYCGESKELIQDILRGEWGFEGLVMSDWVGIWNPEIALKYGVDLEMPGKGQTDVFSPETIQQYLSDGTVSIEDVDYKVKNIIRACLKLNLYNPDWSMPELNDKKKHSEIALQTAREGIVLLKNFDKILPLKPETCGDVIMLGPIAERTPTSGTGSGAVLPENVVNLADAFRANYPNGTVLSTFDTEAIKAASEVIVCVGNNEGFKPTDHRSPSIKSSIMEEQEFFNDVSYDREGEGHDRISFSLSPKHNELIAKCCSLNSNVVIIFTSGGAVDMSAWINNVKAVMWIFYPGEIGARAAIEILSGKVNPSGKLPVSIEKNIEDNSANKNFTLDWDDNSDMKQCGIRNYQDVVYEEGLFIGYRHFDSHNVEPLFCFGHGLSYTEFDYSNLKALINGNEVEVSLDIQNTGDLSGSEIVQIYVSDLESSQIRPDKELKGFKKVYLEAGEKKTISLVLDERAFSFWSENEHKWGVEAGEFKVLIGSSSRDIRLSQTIKLV